jgi:hypothetical protein
MAVAVYSGVQSIISLGTNFSTTSSIPATLTGTTTSSGDLMVGCIADAGATFSSGPFGVYRVSGTNETTSGCGIFDATGSTPSTIIGNQSVTKCWCGVALDLIMAATPTATSTATNTIAAGTTTPTPTPFNSATVIGTAVPCPITLGAVNSAAPTANTVFNLPFTVPMTATNPILIVQVTIPDTSTVITNATYNGLPLTLAETLPSANGNTDYTYYMLGTSLGADSVAHNIVINTDASVPIQIGAMSFMNVSQTAVGHTQQTALTSNTTTASMAITTTAPDSVIVGMVHTYATGTISPMGTQTQEYSVGVVGSLEGDYVTTTTVGAYTLNYLTANTLADMQAIELLPVFCAPTNTPTFTPGSPTAAFTPGSPTATATSISTASLISVCPSGCDYNTLAAAMSGGIGNQIIQLNGPTTETTAILPGTKSFIIQTSGLPQTIFINANIVEDAEGATLTFNNIIFDHLVPVTTLFTGSWGSDSVTFNNCQFVSNHTDDVFAIGGFLNVFLNKCSVIGNLNSTSGIKVTSSNNYIYMQNSIIQDVGNGWAVTETVGHTAKDVFFYDDFVNNEFGLFENNSEGFGAAVTNCISTSAGATEIAVSNPGMVGVSADYCVFKTNPSASVGLALGTHNLISTASTEFVNTTIGTENFNLLASAQSKGNALAGVGGITTDINGLTRNVPDDIGAFAYTGGLLTNTPTNTVTVTPSSPTITATPIWTVVGTPGFSAGGVTYTSLAFDGNSPYVAFADSNNGGKATVASYNGTSWAPLGMAGFSAGPVSYTSLAINGGNVYVAYSDGNAGSGKTTVMEYVNPSWVPVGTAGFSPGQAYSQSLAVDNGTPYVAFEDGGNGDRLTVMSYNGSSWVTLGSPGFTTGVAYNPSLAIYNGTPYVAFQDGGNNSYATVMEYTAGAWEPVGSVGFSGNTAASLSLAFYGSTPYVAYSDGPTGYANVMKYSAGSWAPVGNTDFSSYTATDTSLAIDGSGNLYVAYMDYMLTHRITVMENSGGNWFNVGNTGFSAGEGLYPSLAINPDTGLPYVAYTDTVNGNRATVMQYP